MSRIGKKTIPLPDSVNIKAENGKIYVEGKFGSLSCDLPKTLSLVVDSEKKQVSVSPNDSNIRNTADWGRVRALVANMVTGVTSKFSQVMQIEGVGYKVAIVGKMLNLYLGHSHAIRVIIPADIELKTEGNNITVTSVCKEKLGSFCSFLVKLRPVEPYKGKGVKYLGQYVLRKVGKKK